MEENPSNYNKHEESFDFHELLDQYIRQWKWFVFGVFVCFIMASLYLRYAIPIYSAKATILVKDEKKGGLNSELSAFADLGIMSGVKNNVDNEIEIIHSRRIVGKTVKKLGLNVSYITVGRVKTIEQYKNRPVEFSFYDVTDTFYTNSKIFTITFIDSNHFELLSGTDKLGKFLFGTIINLDDSKLVINKNPKTFPDYSTGSSIIVNVSPIDNITESFRGRLDVTSLSKTSSIVTLSVNDPVKERAEDFLNGIIEVYNEDAIADKKYISENTLNFIQDRLKIISVELGDVEKNTEGFKKLNKITDIPTQAEIFMNSAVDFSKEIIETETQLKVVSAMIDFMKTKGKWDLVPNNIISTVDGRDASAYIMQFNDLVLQRNRIAVDGLPKNSVRINLEQKIEELNANIIESLTRIKATLNIKKSNIDKQDRVIKGQISQIPSQEREFRVLNRQQQIKESLYLYLLQKREETAISLAVTSPISKLVDAAFSSGSPISPKRNAIFFIAFALGLLIPFSIIYVLNIFDNKIKNRHDVESKIPAPFLGDIPKSETHEEIINTNSKSSSAEAIRIIRTNMEFMLTKVPAGQAKTIFITSTIPKEGKTFLAINLASTIALSGKKILLIGLDIRNPKIDRYVKLPSKGLTNFLSKTNLDINDFIVKLDGFDNFYVLPSGVVPPNPVDLLLGDKIDTMFDELKKQYDYIVVDTAPVSLVTDTLLVAKNADIFIYTLRANFLDKRLLKLVETVYKEKRLPNMCLVLNDTVWRKSYTYGYGYGYGYGYDYVTDESDKKSWFSKWFKK